MAELGQVGEAFVRIRADTRGFAEDLNQGVKKSLRSVDQLGAGQGFNRATASAERFGAATTHAGEQAVAASRAVRTAQEQTARDSVAASLAQRRSLAQEVEGYRAVAAASAKGSATQVEANRLAAASAQRLGVELTVVERQALVSAGALSKLERGAIAGSGAFRGMGRSVAFASLSFIGAYGLVGAVRSSIDAVNDLDNQTVRAVTVFRESAPEIERWAQTATHNLGFAKSSALETANAFGTIFTAAGLQGPKAAAFSEDLAKVSAAISLARGESDPSSATAALRVALTGRGRALRAYGIILDDTSIKAKALELGLVRGAADPTKTLLAQRRLNEAVAQAQALRVTPGATGLQIAKADDAVIASQAKLRTALAGTVPALNLQQKAIAAHAIIVEQGARFVDRYGASLDTAAGRSRRFHEGVGELKEELGGALYPSFTKTVEGITDYIASLEEGGKRHEQFTTDLHDVEAAAGALYSGLKLLGTAFTEISTAVGGIGNLVEILGFAYLANQSLKFAAAVRDSRIALFLLGAQAPATATAVVAAETEMTVGAETLGARLGGLAGRLGALGAAVVALQVVTDRSDKRGILGKLLGEFKGQPGIGPLGVTDRALKDLGLGEGTRDLIRRATLDVTSFGSAEAARALFGFGKRASQPLPSPSSAARTLRDQNLGEALIYRSMRAAGYTRQQTLGAITSTREHPGGATASLAPSPEDVRAIGTTAAGDSSAAAAGASTGQKFTTGLITSLKANLGKVRSELADVNREIAQTVSDNAQQMADAVKAAASAELQAITEAKANLNSLGGSLADRINQLLDARGTSDKVDPNSPLAKRLRHIQELIRTSGATPELVQEAKRVQSELDAGSGGDDTDRRTRITRRLADLTDQFNQGRIGVAKFNREVTALLRANGVTYRAAGRALGVAFADGFRESLKELREQAGAIAETPASLRGKATGLEGQIIRPLEVIREQNTNIARTAEQQRRALFTLTQRRHELLLSEQKTSHQLARAQARLLLSAVRARAPGGARGDGVAFGNAPSPEDVRGAPGSGLHGANRRDLVPDLLAQAKSGATKATTERHQIVRAAQSVTTAVGAADDTARGQRSTIAGHTHETNVILRRLEGATKRGNTTSRLIANRLKPRPKPKQPSTRVAAEARQAGTNNLS